MKHLLAVLLVLLLSGKALADPNILILHSYHRGYEWTRSITRAMEAVLTREVPAGKLFIEAMDSKRHPPAQFFPHLQRFYSSKHAGRIFDVVLCSDDNALDFLLTYGDTLFPGVPVVFCGINNFDDGRLAGRKNYTGVVETRDFAGALELALALQPATRQIALISDRTPSGLANLEGVRAIVPRFAARVDFIELVGLSTDRLQQELAALSDKSIVFHLDFFQAAEGRYYTVAESNALISRSSKGPVYVFSDDKIKGGVIGGLVTSGEQQGQTAAEMALRILRGEPASDVAVVRTSPNVSMFDFPTLQRFGIAADSLPPGSRLLNGPPPVDSQHRQQLFLAAAVAATFAGLALWLTIALLQRQRADEALRRNKATIKAMLHSISDPMSMMDRELNVIWANDPAKLLFGEQMVGAKCHEAFYRRSAPCSGPCPIKRTFADGQNHILETNMTDKQGQTRHLHWVAKVALRDQKGQPETALAICRDLTAMKQAEDALHLTKYAIDSSLTPIAMADLEGNVTYANQAFVDLWRYDNEADILGLHIGALHQHRSEVDTLLQQLSTEGSWQGEMESRRRDGSLFTVEMQTNVARDPHGTPLCMIGSFVDITDKRRSEREMQRLACFDGLTGLTNRVLLADHMELAFEQARRCNDFAAILLLDLDNFKQVNDTIGHAKGDLLLQQVAGRLQSALRKSDTLARWGGDEFVLLMSGVKSELDVAKVARKILELFTAQPFDLDGSEVFTSASAGIALFPRDGEDGETLLKHADTAMYQAKRDGRNEFHFFSQAMHERAVTRHQMESNLRRALQAGEFFLVYQPQFDLRSGRPVGVEALVRWHSHELGVIPPSEFIPVAEDTGLIRPLGEWILRTACYQAANWQHRDRSPLKLSVNLSICQFRQPNLVNCIDNLLQETGLSPNLLELEITESVFMEEREASVAILGQLQKRGIQIAIDDFGTGYSSLSYLKNIPIDRIKIAQEFVRDIPHNPDDAAIVQAIIDMAGRLGLQLIAEGVETREQLRFLWQYACYEMQGYFFAKPMAAEHLTEFLKDETLKDRFLYP